MILHPDSFYGSVKKYQKNIIKIIKKQINQIKY